MKPHLIKVSEFPCKKLGYCPYGILVEYFPLEEPRGERSCPVYGHNCPGFYVAEAVDVPGGSEILPFPDATLQEIQNDQQELNLPPIPGT